jgi:hypothetical protein
LARLSIGAGWRTFSNRSATKPPTRTVGLSSLRSSGMRRFQLHQLAPERVELSVGDLGIVEDVVAVLMIPDRRAQPCDALHQIGWVGCRIHKPCSCLCDC